MEEALIQISEVQIDDVDEIQIEINKGNDAHIRLAIPLEDFARILMGQAKTKCKVRRWVIK